MMINLIVHSFIFKQVKRSEFISILIHPYLTNILSKLLIWYILFVIKFTLTIEDQ